MSTETPEGNELNFGDQPLIDLLDKWGITSHTMIKASTEQLNYKQVQRALKGRKLTLKMMQKVARAFNVAIWNELNKEEKEAYFEYKHKHLFNYAKGYDENFIDPNDQSPRFSSN